MNWRETIRTALEAISSRRMRSSLTMLGILIGIAAVMLTVGLGQGAQAKVRDQINQLGSNLLIVSPGSTTSTSGIRGGRGSASTLTMRDAVALASPVVAPDIAKVAPVVTGSQSLTVGTTNWTTNVVGTTPDWLPVRARSLTEGRFFTQAELNGSASVVVLGSTTSTELFGGRDALGQAVSINGSTMTVIGILNTAGSSTTTDEDDQALIPQTTYGSRIANNGNATGVSTLYLGGHIDGLSFCCIPRGQQGATFHSRRDGRRARLHHQQPAVSADHGHLHRSDPDRPSRRHRRDLVAGRRHRRHEYHARVRHGAHP